MVRVRVCFGSDTRREGTAPLTVGEGGWTPQPLYPGVDDALLNEICECRNRPSTTFLSQSKIEAVRPHSNGLPTAIPQ